MGLSSTEAKFIGMIKGLCGLLWFKELLIKIVQHDLREHVEVDHHFIKQKLEVNVFQFAFVKFGDQLVDIYKLEREY
ncbi:hypothetical protein CR513_23594, partial [Mucuna pruriens]